MKMLKVKLNFSTAFHPQTDGQYEKSTSKTLGNDTLLCKLRSEGLGKYLPGIEIAYNNHVNDTTLQTPFNLEYGQHPFAISDIIHSDISENLHSRKTSANHFLQERDTATKYAK